MAERGLLHEKHIEPFIAFCESYGWTRLEPKGDYEKIRLQSPTGKLMLFHQRLRSPHLSIASEGQGYNLVRRFLKEKPSAELPPSPQQSAPPQSARKS